MGSGDVLEERVDRRVALLLVETSNGQFDVLQRSGLETATYARSEVGPPGQLVNERIDLAVSEIGHTNSYIAVLVPGRF